MANPIGYASLQIKLHWISALLVILLLTVLAETISDGWDLLEKSGVRSYTIGVWLHLAPGILVLMLAIWRGVIRLYRGAPALPENEHPWAKKLAHLTHISLYLLLLIVPITGLWAWYGPSDFMAEIHEVTQALMLLLVILHVAAALIHHFILKTNVMRRMIRPNLPD